MKCYNIIICVLTLGAGTRQYLSQWSVWLRHVTADEDGDNAVQFLSVLLPQYRDRLKDQLHLFQLMGAWRNNIQPLH